MVSSNREMIFCKNLPRSFDMVHFGHANALRQAKLMGDILVVALHSNSQSSYRQCICKSLSIRINIKLPIFRCSSQLISQHTKDCL